MSHQIEIAGAAGLLRFPGGAPDWMLLSKAIMQTTEHTFAIRVRTGWIDFSPALHWYATQKVRSALRPVASRVRAVTVRISDHEPHDPSTRLCAIDVTLKSAGTISATAIGRNVCELVDRATAASLDKLHERHHAGVVHAPLLRIA